MPLRASPRVSKARHTAASSSRKMHFELMSIPISLSSSPLGKEEKKATGRPAGPQRTPPKPATLPLLVGSREASVYKKTQGLSPSGMVLAGACWAPGDVDVHLESGQRSWVQLSVAPLEDRGKGLSDKTSRFSQISYHLRSSCGPPCDGPWSVRSSLGQ